MQSIFKEVSLWTDEDVTEESTEMLSELSNIEYFHLQGYLRYFWSNLSNCKRATQTSKPGREEVSIRHDFICPNRSEEVVDD